MSECMIGTEYQKEQVPKVVRDVEEEVLVYGQNSEWHRLPDSSSDYDLLVHADADTQRATMCLDRISSRVVVTTEISREAYDFWKAITWSADACDVESNHSSLKLIDHVESIRAVSKRPVVVGVAGPSGGGKTTLGRLLHETFGTRALLLSLDDYYRGKTALRYMFGDNHVVNWDDPISYDIPRFARDLRRLSEGKPVSAIRYDMLTSEPLDDEQHIDGLETGDVVIAEGLYVLRGSLMNLYDITAFVDAPMPKRLGRRLERDTGSRSTWSAEKNLRYCLEVAEPSFLRYGSQQRHDAEYRIVT